MAWIAEQLLTAIRDERACECITEERLVMTTGLKPRQVSDACQMLRKHQLLERLELGCYHLTQSGREALDAGNARVRSGPKNERQSGKRFVANSLRQRIWRAVCIRRKFTVPEIIALTVHGDERGDVTSNVQKYFKALSRAGYLVEMPRREPCVSPTSPGFKRWWLPDDRYTGPKAPMIRRNYTAVYDPNTETEIDISGVNK